MKLFPLKIPEIIVIEPDVFKDERGFFFEAFNQKKFNQLLGKDITFVQDNHSKSKQGVLRGLHYQEEPFAQAKLIRVVRGEIFDVAVDLRVNSKTFGNWVSTKLSSKNKYMLWIPEGFAHGFATLSRFAEVVYKTTNYYSPENERHIHWKKNCYNIDWPSNIKEVITSAKDGGAGCQ
jgi:dTDP-4-dehydrorhamnose 3,5-epimerase